MNLDTSSIIGVLTSTEMIALMGMMAANVLLSIFAAIKNNVFTLRHLGDFATTRVLPMFSYVVVAILAQIVSGWTAAAITVYVGLVGMYSGGILSAIKSLTGINIPRMLSEK